MHLNLWSHRIKLLVSTIYLNQKFLHTDYGQAQDALDRFTIARQYKSHLDAVGEDRRLEAYLQEL